MSTIKTILIILGIIILVSFLTAKIKGCNDRKDLAEANKPYVEANQRLYDSLEASKKTVDSLNKVKEAFQKSADSTLAIKNHIEKDLFASKNRAEYLAAENTRLKNRKDTSGQLANCDELAAETQKLAIELTQYKTHYDNAISLKDSIIDTQAKENQEVTRSRDKLDSVYKRLYTYNQATYSQLQKQTKKANKTVSLSISAGYGVGIPLNPVAIKPQPIVGITLSKTLIRLW